MQLEVMKIAIPFLLISMLSQAAPTTFTVDLSKIVKSTKPLVLAEATEKEVRLRGPIARMKFHETKAQWAQCADLRGVALKPYPQLAGWIWSLAINCEVRAFEQASSRYGKLKNLAQAFHGRLDLLDRGPWARDLRKGWIQALQMLRSKAPTAKERQKWSHYLYQRPELLTADMENIILRDLQKPFAATTSAVTAQEKPVPSNGEPWWDYARKMDYVQVVKSLEEYFDRNKAPSNLLGAKLLLGRGYLWLGQYEDAKETFQFLREKHPLTPEGTEAAFRLGLLHLRLGNPQLAVKTFDKLIETGREKNPLTTRYWRLRGLQAAGDNEAAEKEREDILNKYPFTYFGLKLRVESHQEGRLEFPETQPVQTRTTWVWPKSAEVPWKRSLELIESGLLWEATYELQEILSLSDAEGFQMWAEFAADMKLDALAIRFAQQAQNLDERLMTWSFQKKFMPSTYEKVIQEQAQTHKVEPWLIWAVIRQESAFNQRAVSSSNAFGLMQLISSTAQEVAHEIKSNLSIPDELFVPEKNIPLGTRYLAKMRNSFDGHWPLAVAAYNAGPTRLKSWLSLRKDTENLTTLKSAEWRDEIWIDELPWNETQNYVKSVMRNFILYRLGSQKHWTMPPVFWSESQTQQASANGGSIENNETTR